MPGQAVVAIRDKQWSVSVANTYAELVAGLSGITGIPTNTGMLFDLSSDRKEVAVDTSRMLFPLDIIFANSTRGVVGYLPNVEPGMEARLSNVTLPGARYFLEVNAGEAEGVEVGDAVAIQGDIQPGGLNLGIVTQGLVATAIVTAAAKVLWPREK